MISFFFFFKFGLRLNHPARPVVLLDLTDRDSTIATSRNFRRLTETLNFIILIRSLRPLGEERIQTVPAQKRLQLSQNSGRSRKQQSQQKVERREGIKSRQAGFDVLAAIKSLSDHKDSVKTPQPFPAPPFPPPSGQYQASGIGA